VNLVPSSSVSNAAIDTWFTLIIAGAAAETVTVAAISKRLHTKTDFFILFFFFGGLTDAAPDIVYT
jgi:hypothetical protein